MNRRYFLILLVTALPATAARRKKLSREQCAALKKRIVKLQSKLRAGYSAKQGVKLRRRQRELELKRYRQCR